MNHRFLVYFCKRKLSPQLYSYTINIGRRKSVNWMNNSIRQQLLGLYESMIFFWIPYEP